MTPEEKARAKAHAAIGMSCLWYIEDGDSREHSFICDDVTAAILEARAEALKDAIEAVSSEHLEDPQDDEDEAYDEAISCAVGALGVLRTLAQRAEPARPERATQRRSL